MGRYFVMIKFQGVPSPHELQFFCILICRIIHGLRHHPARHAEPVLVCLFDRVLDSTNHPSSFQFFSPPRCKFDFKRSFRFCSLQNLVSESNQTKESENAGFWDSDKSATNYQAAAPIEHFPRDLVHAWKQVKDSN